VVAVVDEVDTGIDVRVSNFRIGRHVSAPLRAIVADEVVGFAWQFLDPVRACVRVRARESYSHRSTLIVVRKRQERIVVTEKHRRSHTPGHESHIGVELAAIYLERKWQAGVQRTNVGLRSRMRANESLYAGDAGCLQTHDDKQCCPADTRTVAFETFLLLRCTSHGRSRIGMSPGSPHC